MMSLISYANRLAIHNRGHFKL